MPSNPLNNIVIVLVGTKHPGNLGSVSRAMHNMGLGQLRLVSPQCSITEESYRMARAGKIILERARIYPSLKGALRSVRLTVGTTAKTGGNRRKVQMPRSLVPRILRQAVGQKVALIFGPEDTGLVDADLLLCQVLVRIPTDPRAHSINLAQAVMIFCYELFLGQLEWKPRRVPVLATVQQVESMYEHLRAALFAIGFLHPKNDRHMMFALRRLLGRAGLEEADVSMLRGIARQVAGYSVRKGQEDFQSL